MSQTIASGKVVAVHFRMTDERGRVVEDTWGDEPMIYLHGAGELLAGLARALEGRAVGDRVEVTVPPEDGFGRRFADAQIVPRHVFPEDMPLRPGVSFVANTHGGRRLRLWVKSVTADQVVVDPNHPLAGRTLHFEVEVVDIREATPAERMAGRVTP